MIEFKVARNRHLQTEIRVFGTELPFSVIDEVLCQRRRCPFNSSHRGERPFCYAVTGEDQGSRGLFHNVVGLTENNREQLCQEAVCQHLDDVDRRILDGLEELNKRTPITDASVLELLTPKSVLVSPC